jgi:hypothetical protein
MQKTDGRKVGALNKHTTEIRWAIGEVARRVGGVDRLVAWVMESPENGRAFWTGIWPRLLPVRVEGSGERDEIELSAKIKPEELERRLEERGLPTFVFGIDKPTLEIEPRRIEGNGSSEPED